jgi:hypothetical protein
MMRLSIGLACSVLAGCIPTAHERFGDLAHYAPSYGAYVVGADDDVLILRDPVTSEKIRCKDDLERAAPALAAALDDAARDRHARDVAPLALAPITGTGYAAALLGIGLWSPAEAFAEGVAPPQPHRVYEAGRAAYLAGRFAEAREHFLVLAIVRPKGGIEIGALPAIYYEHALYYLALSDEELHQDAEAKAALSRFLTTSNAKNEARYRDAEERLARLSGPSVPRCASRADVVLAARPQ